MRLDVPAMRPEVRLDPHQVDALRWMSKRPRFLLADMPGLGKSCSSMAFAAWLQSQKRIGRILVVSPANLKSNFAAEVEKFTSFDTVILEGRPAKRDKILSGFDGDILIVSYEQVVAHLDQLNRVGFRMIVCDESHYLKSPDAARTQAVMGLDSTYLCLMTGTPLENAPNELWTTLEMIDPGAHGTYEEFKADWCVIRTFEMERTLRNGHVVTVEVEKIVGCTDGPGLHALLSPYMLRRNTDVLKLEEPRFIPVLVHMGPKQRNLYDQAEAELGVELDEKWLAIPDNRVLSLRLRQIASTTATIDEGGSDVSAKLDVAVDKIDELIANDETHIVVFTQFKATARAMCNRIAGKSWLFTGDQSGKVRDHHLAMWREGGGVLVATMQTAGTGLTLTEARALIVLEKPYTPSKYEQAVKRVWRRGQDRVPLIYEFCAVDSIDEIVDKIHARKQSMADEIVDGVSDDWDDDELDAWLDAELTT